MTVHQAAVLLHFNGTTSCTVDDIEGATLLKGELLHKNIKSLQDCGLLKSVKKYFFSFFNFILFFFLIKSFL